ncbi:MAG: efflux RND transporter periplasmic adaptor subunit [Anaerolineae bacterium]|nr:efflux RND transporter periplasmic adaptor subunit [Anaerolineae bacterium]
MRKLTMTQLTTNNGSLFIVSLFLVYALLLSGCSNDGANGPITASGFIEGEEVSVAPEVSGRIVEITVDRGDRVEAGQVLVRLDDAVLQSQRRQAEAGLAAARANLARVRAGARPQELAAARAALAQAEAARDGAFKAVLDARSVISNPLELNAQIDAARTQVRLAEQNVEMARANLAEVELKRGVYGGKGGDTERMWNLQVQAAQAALAQAQAELDGARAYLNVLLRIRANPLTLRAQLHAAEAQYRQAEAQVDIAQAALEELEAGPTPEEVALAEAQVRQAEVAVRLVDAQIAQLTLTAPMDGIVTTRSAQVGETAQAGLPLLTIANLDEVTLVIYIPANRIGHVQPGQEVEVRVDSFPGQVFLGQVASIAGEAEFTPRNVQTQEERVHLVFAVRVRIPNPDHLLKAGMPADALIRPTASGVSSMRR